MEITVPIIYVYTVNLVKLATGRGALVATEWENPLIEVTCNNSVVEVLSFCFTKLTVLNGHHLTHLLMLISTLFIP